MREVKSIPIHDDLLVPNCPSCLEPMEPVVGAWWCAACAVRQSPVAVAEAAGALPAGANA